LKYWRTYGSLSSEDQELLKADPDKFFSIVRSVTRKEYEKARDRDIPIFIFVEAGVLSEHKTFQANKDNSAIKYAHVDDKRIYDMLDDIFVQRRNNFVKGFSGHEEILEWLREQWAGIFAEALKRRQADIKLKNLETQISELSNLVTSLKSYSEEIVKIVTKESSPAIITKVNKEFRERQIKNFAQEDLIRHIKLINEIERGEGSVDDTSVFQQFLSSKDLEDFLKRIQFSDFSALSITSRALEDFRKLKNQYLASDVSS
jgi:hypothetical protein